MKKKILAAVLLVITLVAIALIMKRDAVTDFFSPESQAGTSIQAGLHALSVGNTAQAIRKLEAAVSLDPKNPMAPYYLAKAYKQAGEPIQRQILAYQKSLELDPDFTEARISLGTAYIEDGKKAVAEQEFIQVLKNDPANAKANNNMGRLRLESQKLSEAEAFFKRALETDPNYEFALNNLGNTLYLAGKYSEAEQIYKRSLAIEPKHPGTHCYLALIAERQKDKPAAVEHWKKAIEQGLEGEELKEAQEHLEKLK